MFGNFRRKSTDNFVRKPSIEQILSQDLKNRIFSNGFANLQE